MSAPSPMATDRIDLVTGAFSFTGQHIAARLLARSIRVRTLTGHPERGHPFADRIEAYPYHFEDPGRLEESLAGIHTLYNTYWVRFDHGDTTYERAIENTRRLFEAARRAGVRRVVHVSIANPSETSRLPYYRGKARVESHLRESGASYAILRPTVLFGEGGILINNIAWLLRRLPIFVIPGGGRYRIQPVHVDDVAKLAVDAGDRSDNLAWDAVGPETYSYRDLVGLIRRSIGSRSLLLPLPATLGFRLGQLLGQALRDVLITRDEVAGLMDELLISHESPRCETRFSHWLEANSAAVGQRYLSELALHYT